MSCSTTAMPGANPTWARIGRRRSSQLGTVGSGNHYVDLMRDEAGFVWIGVHFGSRGLGHTSATRYLKAAGGKDGMNVPPAVIDEDSEIGRRYIAAMQLAGRYSYAGREWVIERVRKIIGGNVTDMVHNHHNYAWRENHAGKDLWVVRKGATPAFPGQRGFIGGSMGDDAVIVEGVDSPEAKASLYSTVHGAGRMFGRREAKRQVYARRDGCVAAIARRDVDRRRSRRKPDGLSKAARGACRACRLDQGAAHVASVRRRHGGRERIRSVQGLIAKMGHPAIGRMSRSQGNPACLRADLRITSNDLRMPYICPRLICI